jgi:hypothetical protein
MLRAIAMRSTGNSTLRAFRSSVRALRRLLNIEDCAALHIVDLTLALFAALILVCAVDGVGADD